MQLAVLLEEADGVLNGVAPNWRHAVVALGAQVAPERLRVRGGGDPSVKYGDDWRPEIQAALNKWKERGGFTNQTGTSNTASPAVMRGSQPTPKHVPSVAKRASNLAPRGLDRAGSGLGPIAEPQRRGTGS